MELRTGLSYDDVLILPHRSPVDSRENIDLSAPLTPDITLDIPIVSSPMDTVTESETAIALGNLGGLGIIHRFMTIDEQAEEVTSTVQRGVPTGAAVGIDEDYLTRAATAIEAGARCITVDVAHGHLEKCLDAVSTLTTEFDIPVIAGNVVTPSGVSDLYEAGASAVKIGVGPGSHCTTRQVTGIGAPQFTAITDCAPVAHDHGITLIADGGIRFSGDAVKALMAGADTVMMGGFFAGTTEAPGELVEHEGTTYKRTRGMATEAANVARTDKEEVTAAANEGVEGLTPYRGDLEPVLREFILGIRSGISYCGGHTIPEAREHATFIQVTQAGTIYSGPHSIVLPANTTAR